MLNKIPMEHVESLKDTILNDEDKKPSLAQEVYTILLNMLVNEEIPSGTILNRRAVASKLGVSVAPVHEAFNKLEWEGFIRTIPRKGTQVIIPSVGDIIDNMVAREALEAQCARIIHGNIVQENYDELLPIAVNLDSMLVQEDSRSIKYEAEFHGRLMKLTNNSYLISMHETLLNRGIFLALHNKLSYVSSKKLDNHQHLLTCLLTDDVDEAENAIRYHLWTSISSLEASMQGFITKGSLK